MNTNPTLMNFTRAHFSQRLILVAVGLTVLFTAISPESTRSLATPVRLLFWSLHIGIGLAAAILVAHVLTRYLQSVRDWRLVFYSGLGGVLLFAPFAFGIESLFPLSADDAASDWGDEFARMSVLAAILVEAIELAPSYLASWFLINIGQTTVFPVSEVDHAKNVPLGKIREPDNDADDGLSSMADSEETVDNPSNSFLDRLPPAIGTDLIAVSSDLHYLHVFTAEGKAMVLGALQDVEKTLGDRGLRVHRSHWVALDAVVSFRKAGTGWRLELLGGHSVPVSRRKKSLVQQRLGEGFVRSTRIA